MYILSRIQREAIAEREMNEEKGLYLLQMYRRARNKLNPPWPQARAAPLDTSAKEEISREHELLHFSVIVRIGLISGGRRRADAWPAGLPNARHA